MIEYVFSYKNITNTKIYKSTVHLEKISRIAKKKKKSFDITLIKISRIFG